MKIATRLSLAGAVAVAFTAVIVAVVISATADVRTELARNEVASEILNAVVDLRYLTLDYGLHHEPRAEVQWRRRHASLNELLTKPRTELLGRDEPLVQLRDTNRSVQALFAEILANRTDLERVPERRAIAQEFEERVTGQLIVRLETMIGDARARSEQSRTGVLAAQRRATITVVTLGIMIVFVVGSTMVLVLRSVSRPLAALREGTAVIGAGDLGFRLAANSRDEIGDLARAFNAMAARLQTDLAERRRAQDALARTQADLAHVARVATLGEMTASIAHEVNQPLGAIVNNANAGLRWLAANNIDGARESAALVVADGHRASEILARVRAMVRKAPPDVRPLDINDAIREALTLAASEADKQGVPIETRLSPDVPRVRADRVQVQQVVLNLVINAIEAMPGTSAADRRVTVASQRIDHTSVVITVTDQGAGIDPGECDRLFEAFYSTKPNGLGMGLAISRAIVQAHHGRLWATPNRERGTTFQFTLPIAGEH